MEGKGVLGKAFAFIMKGNTYGLVALGPQHLCPVWKVGQWLVYQQLFCHHVFQLAFINQMLMAISEI